MFDKLRKICRRVFSSFGGKDALSSENKALFRRLTRDSLPLSNEKGCVFEGQWLHEITAPLKGPSKPLAENETFWAVPAEDVRVEIVLPFEDENAVLSTSLLIHTEPKNGLGAFLNGRQELTVSEFSDLIYSRFTGFLSTVGGTLKPEELESLDAEPLERLRAKFSLLLFSMGFRCAGIAPFVRKEVQVSSEEVKADDETVQELAEEFDSIETEADIDSLLGALIQDFERDGAVYFEDEQTQLQDVVKGVGEEVLAKRMTSEEAAKKISRAAEDAARENKIERPDAANWNGLALRLRLDSDNDYADDSDGGKEPKQKSSQSVQVSRSSRPRNGFLSRYAKIDKRLRFFVSEKIQASLDSASALSAVCTSISAKAALREIVQELRLTNDLLMTTPEFKIMNKDFRIKRSKFKPLVKELNGAVTAAEYVEAALSQADAENIESVIPDIRKAVFSLNTSLKNRRQLR